MESAPEMADLARHKGEWLYFLEQVILDDGESVLVRRALLDVIVEYREEAIRQFLAGLLTDPLEHEELRNRALHHLSGYRGRATFGVLREVYEREPEFPGRQRLLLAMGETRAEGAAVYLLSALGSDGAPELRCGAARGLSRFVDRRDVRTVLEHVARRDASILVRKASLESLGSGAGEEIDVLLRRMGEDPNEPEEVRQCAQECLKRRGR